jgi:hypothetical protein
VEKCGAQIDELKIKYDGFSDSVPQLPLTTPNRLHIETPPSLDGLLLHGRAHLDLEFYGVYLPPLISWYASCDWWGVQFLVVPFPPWVLSGSLSSMWPVSFGLPACLDFGPCPLFLFLSLASGCFLFIKFGKVSSDYTFNEGDALHLFS